MTQKEKKLLIIFVALFGLAMVVQGIPFAIKTYSEGVEAVDDFKLKRKRLKKLLARQDYWKAEFDKTTLKEQQLNLLLYRGQSPDLMAGRVQGKLKKLTGISGIKVDSMSLAEKTEAEGWLLITQSMNFKATADQLMKLIKLIDNAKPKLIITDLRIRSYRNLLNCTIKVVGFSRTNSNEQGNT